MVKYEREQKQSLNTVAVSQGLEETLVPCLVTQQSWLREMRMAGEFGGLLRAIKNDAFSPSNHLSFPHSALEVWRLHFLMSILSQGHLWLGKWVADLMKHNAVDPWGRVYRGGAQGLWSRPLGDLKMTKVTQKPQGSRALMEQPAADNQEEKMKTSCQLRSTKLSRWLVPTQAPLAHWHHPMKPPPLYLPGT